MKNMGNCKKKKKKVNFFLFPQKKFLKQSNNFFLKNNLKFSLYKFKYFVYFVGCRL